MTDVNAPIILLLGFLKRLAQKLKGGKENEKRKGWGGGGGGGEKVKEVRKKLGPVNLLKGVCAYNYTQSYVRFLIRLIVM